MAVDALSIPALAILLIFTAVLSYVAWFQYDRLVNALIPSSPDESRGCLHALYASPILKWTVRAAYVLMLVTTVALLIVRLTSTP